MSFNAALASMTWLEGDRYAVLVAIWSGPREESREWPRERRWFDIEQKPAWYSELERRTGKVPVGDRSDPSDVACGVTG